MGVSTDGQICYGICVDEIELPWDESYDGDIESWWTFEVLGFKHSFELFTEEGDWIDEIPPPDEKVKQYYAEVREFEANNPPCPVTLVNYCTSGYPMYIIALAETYHTAIRGYPEVFSPEELVITEEQRQTLIEFCDTYRIEHDDEPAWYLSSYWG